MEFSLRPHTVAMWNPKVALFSSRKCGNCNVSKVGAVFASPDIVILYLVPPNICCCGQLVNVILAALHYLLMTLLVLYYYYHWHLLINKVFIAALMHTTQLCVLLNTYSSFQLLTLVISAISDCNTGFSGNSNPSWFFCYHE